jgi:hypothetical protein
MKEMSACLIHPNTPEKWTSFMRDSLAKILAQLGSKQVLVREPDQAFTVKYCVLLASLDLMSSSWRMSPLLKAKDLKRYSKTWPSWGMTQGGSAYVHPMSEHLIRETGGSCWPTPTAHNAKETNAPSESKRNTPTLAARVGGKLNPMWVEWLMGFPLEFTASKDWVTPKSRFKQQLPIGF